MELSIDQQITELPKLTKSDLSSLWQHSFGKAAPPKLRRQVMIPILAYRIQEKAYGGLTPSTARYLRSLADALEKDRHAVVTDVLSIRPGTRLVREWRGNTYEVLAETSGYEYRGKNYASLSGIARQITGTRWSGPAFFRIKNTKTQAVK
jgi:hypothetical protein